MSRFGLFGKMTAVAGQRDALVRNLLEAAELVADLPGCEVWIVNTAPDDPDSVWVTEVWRSKHDHASSLTDERVRALIARTMPLIADSGERIVLEPVGGKGLAATP